MKRPAWPGGLVAWNIIPEIKRLQVHSQVGPCMEGKPVDVSLSLSLSLSLSQINKHILKWGFKKIFQKDFLKNKNKEILETKRP